MEVVREYPADERTAAARTGLVGPAGVPGGVAGMSNGLGLCRRQLGQQWSCMRACTMKHEEQKPCVESQPGHGRHKSSWRGGAAVERARGPGVILKRRFLEQEHVACGFK
nr:hypothetical protein [Tanacetum cinerariifolium]